MATVYAKKCDKDRSTVTFEAGRAHLDLYLPDSKRFKRTLELYGPIKPDSSSYKIYGTKVRAIVISNILLIVNPLFSRWIWFWLRMMPGVGAYSRRVTRISQDFL